VSDALLRLPSPVLFGPGAARATARSAREFGKAAFVVTDPVLADSDGVHELLGDLTAAGVAARLFAGTAPDVPLTCVDEALAAAGEGPVDVVIGFGGGSCLDLAKVTALLLRHPGPIDRYYGENAVPGPVAPVIALPTTAGTGSEVTPVAVVSDPSRRLKVGVSSPWLVPRLAVCDSLLTRSCPPRVTAFAGVDALVHAVEAFTALEQPAAWDEQPWPVFRGKNVVSDLFGLAAIERIAGALERAVGDGEDLDARESMLLGSLYAGVAFGHAGTAAAHALQYPVGAETGTPHGLGVGLLAPYVLTYVGADAEAELRQVATALGVADAVTELERVSRAVGVPHTLREIGVERGRLEPMATEAAGIERLVRNSPRPLDAGDLLTILEAAWDGDRARLASV
jgi:alcohol dehydrogenase class IV